MSPALLAGAVHMQNMMDELVLERFDIRPGISFQDNVVLIGVYPYRALNRHVECPRPADTGKREAPVFYDRPWRSHAPTSHGVGIGF